MSTNFSDLSQGRCPLLEQPTDDMCVGDLVKLLAYNTAVLERTLLNNVVPAGVISYFSGSEEEVPAGSLICDGKFYEPETYPELFDSIRYSYGKGVGNNESCFAVPDLRVSMVQGMALGSTKMSPDEQPNWKGNDPVQGAEVEGDVVGARITHRNTESGIVAGSRYDKVALIPVISTGEVCGRDSVDSTTTQPCSISATGDHTLDLNGRNLCILNEFGAVSIVFNAWVVPPKH